MCNAREHLEGSCTHPSLARVAQILRNLSDHAKTLWRATAEIDLRAMQSGDPEELIQYALCNIDVFSKQLSVLSESIVNGRFDNL